MSPWAIKRLGKAIQQGAVIVYPTDTIWGLGCHPLLTHSVGRILNIKQRPVDKGLILLGSRLEFFESYISNQLDAEQIARLQEITEHPVTWLVPAGDQCPDWIRGYSTSVAIRITSHPFIIELCDQIRSPIVSTSANRSGSATVRNAWQAHREFTDQVDYIVSGYNPGTKRASEIKSLEGNKILRSHPQ